MGFSYIIVTGASRGIGLSIAESLIEKGYGVIGISRTPCESLKNNSHYHQVIQDLLDLKGIENSIKNILKKNFVIEGVVINAGRGLLGSLEGFSAKDIEETIKLNLLHPIFLAKALVPYFKTKRKGSLIFMGSESALEGHKNGSIYSASKFGLRGFCESLREECRSKGVRVMMLHPGVVNSPDFFKQLPIEPHQESCASLEPQDVASLVVYMLQAPQSVLIEEIECSPLVKKVQFKK